MKKIFLILLFCFMASTVSAEFWVCKDGNTLRRFSGDGYKLGIATLNYAVINPNCIMATRSQYQEAGLQFKKLSGGDVVDWTQAEIDAFIQAEADAFALAETNRLSAIDDGISDTNMTGTKLTRSETIIGNIGDLQDVKRFLRRLTRYISTE